MDIKQVLPRSKSCEVTTEKLKQLENKARIRLMEKEGFCDPECDICGGIGRVRIGDGRLKFCPKLSMWDRPGSNRYGISETEAEELYWDHIFPDNNADRAVEIVKNIIEEGFGWIYIFGSYGLGKSEIIKTAIAETLRKKIDASYIRFAEILDHLRQGFNDQDLGENERLKWWSEIPVLAIDEFDRIRETEYSKERRFVLMNRRYQLALQKEGVTLIASNCNPSELPGYLYDRIRDGRFHIVKLSGKSWRPGMDWL